MFLVVGRAMVISLKQVQAADGMMPPDYAQKSAHGRGFALLRQQEGTLTIMQSR